MKSVVKKIITVLLLFWFATSCAQINNSQEFDSKVQKILTHHYYQYKNPEYFSGAELSILIPKQNIKNYYIGRISHDPKSKLISKDTLFQIGDITKSFTATILLQLEKEGKLKLTDSLKIWLPQYSKWPEVSINELLNMTSGIPNYAASPLLGSQLYYNPSRVWNTRELIDLVYPPGAFNPPMKNGFFDSDTNDLLASLIIEKATKDTFAKQINLRAIKKANLSNTFYLLGSLKPAIQSRMAHGYYYRQYDNTAMVGKDVYEGNLSWAGAAGGVISNSEDVIKWVSYISNNHVLENEGRTLGHRSIYWYKECNGIIISAIFNSVTDQENDHSDKLLQQVYQYILTQYPQLKCPSK